MTQLILYPVISIDDDLVPILENNRRLLQNLLNGTLDSNNWGLVAVYPVTPALARQAASGLYAGTGAPNNANGNNGDFYFRSDGGAGTTIYQRRAGAWVGIV